MIRFALQQTRTLLLAAPALASSVLHCYKVGLLARDNTFFLEGTQ